MVLVLSAAASKRRSREGAWIEIDDGMDALKSATDVAPVRERGLKYVFIV